MRITHSQLRRCAVAALSVGLALLLTLLLQPVLQSPFLGLFYAAVAISAWYGGRTSGLLAAALSSLAIAYFLLPPVYSLSATGFRSLLQIGVFVLVAGIIGSLNVQLQVAQRRAEKNRQQRQVSEEQYRVLAENVPQLVWMAQPNGSVEYFNSRWYAYTGLTPDESLGDQWQQVVHPDDLPNALAQWTAGLASGATIEAQCRLKRSDGEYRWHIMRALPLHDGHCGAAHWFGSCTDIHDQNQMAIERAQLLAILESKQALLETVLQQMPAGLIVAEAPSGRFLLMNRNVQKIVPGFPEAIADVEGYIPLPFQALHSNELPYTPGELPLARSLLTGEVITSEELIAVMPNGSRKVLLVDSSPICNADGAIEAAVTTFYDITHRKQAQEALRQSEARRRMATEAARMVTWSWNAKTNRIKRSDNAREILGLASHAVTGSGSAGWEIVHPDDRAQHQAAVQAAVDAQSSYHSQFRVVRPDTGATIWVEDRGKPTYDSQGNLTSVEGTLFDITARKQAEEALQKSEALYRTLGEAVPDFVWSCDADGETDYVNARWMEYTGLTLEQLNVGGLKLVYHPDDFSAAVQAWKQAIVNRDLFKVELRYRRHDGIYRWFMERATPVKDDSGNITRWIGTTTDIHERRQAEDEREALLIREQSARQQAETTNRIKDEFLAVLSHELRSPLNPILGWAKLLRSRTFDQDATDRALEIIERNAKLQAQLVEDLLDVSRILRGKLSLTITPVNLIPTIDAALETVRLSAQAKAIDLQFVVGDSESEQGDSCTQPLQPGCSHSNVHAANFTVLGDSARLQQIVWNLLTNAVKFTPSGGHVIVQLERMKQEMKASAASISHPPDCVQIRVTDSGQGISSDFLPYVFDYFRQEDSSTTRSFGGLGLGLAIVRHLVELHGGIVWAESPGDGQGATFTVQLPLLKQEDGKTKAEPGLTSSLRSDERSHQSLPPAPSLLTAPSVRLSVHDEASLLPPHPSSLTDLHILAVDDEIDMREYVTTVLEQAGAQVISVDSAAAALTAIAQSRTDLLIVDIGMPAVDGYTLLRQLRTLPADRGGDIPAIALTAYAAERDQQQALEAGFQLHLPKPVDPERLIEAIENVLAGPNRSLRTEPNPTSARY